MIKRRTLVFMLLLLSGGALADDFVGQASVVDGDTLEIHGIRIRLWGIDAPESSQLCRGENSLQYRCGAQAANDLDAFIARRPVNCSPLSLDPYGRTVATCSVGGTDLGEWLVRKGLALDWPQYSKGRYGDAQRDAERAGWGIWKGSYVEPWLYRACIRANGTPFACSDDANAHPCFGPGASRQSPPQYGRSVQSVQLELARFGRLALTIVLDCLTAQKE